MKRYKRKFEEGYINEEDVFFNLKNKIINDRKLKELIIDFDKYYKLHNNIKLRDILIDLNLWNKD
jgi:hypothetical protein